MHEGDLAIAYQIATLLRQWRDAQPDWRLPELVAELGNIVSGRRSLPISSPTDFGYEPVPGRVTLTTQHSAKGLEWDAVFMIGVDGYWIPSNLDSYFLGVSDILGGDPTAEVVAQLRYLMEPRRSYNKGMRGFITAVPPPNRPISTSLPNDYACCTVGITRARRFLQLSRSRATRSYNKERDAPSIDHFAMGYELSLILML
ncbi:MAG: hypothetical protein H6652_17975 [Ardenticatenaceae bacterium]|nr:hypothetical protein [Ardenticatenaceae bacterium]